MLDGTKSISVNHRTRLRDQERAPVASERFDRIWPKPHLARIGVLSVLVKCVCVCFKISGVFKIVCCVCCVFWSARLFKHHQNSTKGPPRERRKKEQIRWEREKKREILGPPPFGAPPFGAPPFRGPTFSRFGPEPPKD